MRLATKGDTSPTRLDLIPYHSSIALLEAYSDISATISVGVTRLCSAFFASCIISPRPLALTTQMTIDTIVNLFRVSNLNFYICKSDGTSWCLHRGYSVAFLGYLDIDTSTLSLCWWSTVTFVLFKSQEARPRGSTTVTNTEDYQPQGTDFRVEYLYGGFCPTFVFQHLPSSFVHSTCSVYLITPSCYLMQQYPVCAAFSLHPGSPLPFGSMSQVPHVMSQVIVAP
jgi:hypothetical protein